MCDIQAAQCSAHVTIVTGGYCTVSRDFSNTFGYVAHYFSTANYNLHAANHAMRVQEEEAEQGCLEHELKCKEKKKPAR